MRKKPLKIEQLYCLRFLVTTSKVYSYGIKVSAKDRFLLSYNMCPRHIYTKFIENQRLYKFNSKEFWVTPSRSLVLSITEASLGILHLPSLKSQFPHMVWNWNFDHGFSLTKDDDWWSYDFDHITHVYFTDGKLFLLTLWKFKMMSSINFFR